MKFSLVASRNGTRVWEWWEVIEDGHVLFSKEDFLVSFLRKEEKVACDKELWEFFIYFLH